MKPIDPRPHEPLRRIAHEADRDLTLSTLKSASDDELRGAQAIFHHWAELMRHEMDRRAKGGAA